MLNKKTALRRNEVWLFVSPVWRLLDYVLNITSVFEVDARADLDRKRYERFAVKELCVFADGDDATAHDGKDHRAEVVRPAKSDAIADLELATHVHHPHLAVVERAADQWVVAKDGGSHRTGERRVVNRPCVCPDSPESGGRMRFTWIHCVLSLKDLFHRHSGQKLADART